jgi:hypothetical protein
VSRSTRRLVEKSSASFGQSSRLGGCGVVGMNCGSE